MKLTKILGAQAGIQYSGISDKSEADPTVQLLNSVVFGQFKRGRFDKPFKVTSDNIRAKLGYDPTNKDYVAVEDALASGAPFVWVMRVLNQDSTSNPEPVWGLWQLDQEISIGGNMARYTASKTNGKQLASSYAEIDLIAALVRSFSDIDMQQWQAVKDAANQLTGVNDWVLDPANNRIVYKGPTTTDPQKNEQYMWKFEGSGVFTDLTLSYGLSAEAVCNAVLGASSNRSPWFYNKVRVSSKSSSLTVCYLSSTKTSFNGNSTVSRVANPAYDPDAEDQKETLPLETVAQKVISNAESLEQGISLLAETYIKTVAKSIFSSDQSKQFVKQDDLVPQFEENKILN